MKISHIHPGGPLAIAALLMAPPTLAQGPADLGSPASQGTQHRALATTAAPVTGAVRNAGTYHLPTGTWTRNPSQSSAFGPDVIYANTAPSGYFSSSGGAGGFAPLSTNIDEGFIPNRGSLEYPAADRALYSVNCFEISYCDLGAAATGGWEISFYESYGICTTPPPPTATIQSTGLPSGGCWTINMDLAGGQEFDMAGEGGGPNAPFGSQFGWSYKYIGTDGSQPAGFILAGDPSSTDPNYVPGSLPTAGTGTYYGPASLCGMGATGNRTQDIWYLDDPTGVNSNCYFFGGYSNNNGCGGPSNPYSSFHMQIFADIGPGNGPVGTTYCTSTPNSTGANTALTITGSDSASAGNVLLASALPADSFGVFLTSQMQGFMPNAMGSQGTLCLAGSIGYFTGPGQVQSAGPEGLLRLDTTLGVWNLAAIPTGTGTVAAGVGITSNFQLWHRDLVGGVPVSNFSDAVSVTWTM